MNPLRRRWLRITIGAIVGLSLGYAAAGWVEQQRSSGGIPSHTPNPPSAPSPPPAPGP